MNLANAKINAQAVELLEPSLDHDVLEVGFGGGAALAMLAARAGCVAGIDPSQAAVRAAGRRFHDEIEAQRMQLRDAVAEDVPFADGSFDCALSVNAIYFWSDPDAGLHEIHRVLKPDGRLVLATESRRLPNRIAALGFTPYGEEEQASLLHHAGFSNIRIHRRGPFVFAIAVKSGSPPAAPERPNQPVHIVLD